MEPTNVAVTYKHDVAISFLAPDEPLAVRLRAALAPLRVFVYSKAQEQIAGTDGLETFRETFRHHAHIVVVLYRAGWGGTRWTNVEETAIKDLCFEGAWDRVLFVALDKSQRPKWLPDRRIYLDFETFGFSEAVGAIKARCVNAGIDVKPPTALDRAKRLAAEEDFKRETEQLIRGSPEPRHKAAVALFSALDQKLAQIEAEAGWKSWRGFTGEDSVAAFEPAGPSIRLAREWDQREGEALIVFRLYAGRVLTPQEQSRGGWTMQAPVEFRRGKLKLTRTPALGWCWREGERILSTDAAAEYLTDLLVAEHGRPAPSLF